MIHDGIRSLIVQPTHILDGIENNVMKEAVLSYKDSFDQIVSVLHFLPLQRTKHVRLQL